MSLRVDDAACRQALVARLRALTPEDTRRWGQMTAHQAVCHLRDALRGMIHHEPVAPVHNLFTRTVMRWVALHSGMAWPRGVKTVRELDAQQGGSHPGNFAQDRDELIALTEQFATLPAAALPAHPIFGPLTTDEWQHWAWRHADHHLRQFGR
jgi:hypothetical protein